MESIDLYYFPASPPSRAVLLLSKFLGIMVNVKVINIMAGEQFSPEFLKINPMHTLPVIDDNGFYLRESHAILQYLVNQYSPDNKLLPKDPKRAAIVSQQLFFDATTLDKRMRDYLMPVLRENQRPDNAKKVLIEDALKIFDLFLEQNKWAAGENITIADFALLATTTTLQAIQIDMEKYPHVSQWIDECKKCMVDYEEVNQKGVDMMGAAFSGKLNSF